MSFATAHPASATADLGAGQVAFFQAKLPKLHDDQKALQLEFTGNALPAAKCAQERGP